MEKIMQKIQLVSFKAIQVEDMTIASWCDYKLGTCMHRGETVRSLEDKKYALGIAFPIAWGKMIEAV